VVVVAKKAGGSKRGVGGVRAVQAVVALCRGRRNVNANRTKCRM